MKIKKFSTKPLDINERIGAKPVVCYPNNNIEEKNLNILSALGARGMIMAPLLGDALASIISNQPSGLDIEMLKCSSRNVKMLPCRGPSPGTGPCRV